MQKQLGLFPLLNNTIFFLFHACVFFLQIWIVGIVKPYKKCLVSEQHYKIMYARQKDDQGSVFAYNGNKEEEKETFAIIKRHI